MLFWYSSSTKYFKPQYNQQKYENAHSANKKYEVLTFLSSILRGLWSRLLIYHSDLAAELMLSSQGNAPGLFHLGLTWKARQKLWFNMQRPFTMSRFHTTLWLPSAIFVAKIQFHCICLVEQQRIPSDPFPHDNIHPMLHCKHPALAKGTQVWKHSCRASTCSSRWDRGEKPGKENKILGF